MVDHFCATYGFLKHFDTKIIYIYISYMSEFVFCQTQISMSHISAYKHDFHLKFWGWSNWPPAMLHTKFQVSSSSGTYFSGTQIWPKSAVNWILYVYRPSKRFWTLLGFDFRVMKGCFYDVFGLPYRLASLLIHIDQICVEVFGKTIRRTEMIDHSFERKLNGAWNRLC